VRSTRAQTRPSAEGGRHHPQPRRATKRRLSGKGAAIALIAALLAVGAAYGATWGLSAPPNNHRQHSPIAGIPLAKKRLPRPVITAHPETRTSSTATFRLSDRARRVNFECHLDASAWKRCGRTVAYASVEAGRHRFFARATRAGVGNSRIAAFTWTVETPVAPVSPDGLPFEIAQSGPPPLLYPGAGPSPLPVAIINPNPDEIQVTSLAVDVTGGPAGCDPRVNLRIGPSTVSPADPLAIPAGGTLPVTAAQAPTIELAETGMSQDACQGGSFSLRFSGSAHG
jgi:hypothetical protein